jgi:hypothetical protein
VLHPFIRSDEEKGSVRKINFLLIFARASSGIPQNSQPPVARASSGIPQNSQPPVFQLLAASYCQLIPPSISLHSRSSLVQSFWAIWGIGIIISSC